MFSLVFGRSLPARRANSVFGVRSEFEMPNRAPTKDSCPIPFREKAEEEAPTSEGIPVVHVSLLGAKALP